MNLLFRLGFQLAVYPKVKVRQESFPEDDDDADVRERDLGLKTLLSLSLHDSPSPDEKVVSMPSIVKAPKCYVPHARVDVPRVPLTEDFEDSGLTSDSSRSTGHEKDVSTDENKVNIRASAVPRPRAVISSPDNDTMIGNRNKTRDGRLSASKNGTMLQNRHTHCKVKSHAVADIPSDTRKYKEPGSKDKTYPVAKKKVHKCSIKSENVSREWKF